MLAENSEIRQGGSKYHDETLKDYGITKLQSHRWQLESSVTDEIFERYIAETKASGELTAQCPICLALETQHLILAVKHKNRSCSLMLLNAHFLASDYSPIGLVFNAKFGSVDRH